MTKEEFINSHSNINVNNTIFLNESCVKLFD